MRGSAGGGGEDGDARVREYVIHYLNMRALNGGSSRTLYMHIRHFCGYTAHVRAATIIHAAYTVTFSRGVAPPPTPFPLSAEKYTAGVSFNGGDLSKRYVLFQARPFIRRSNVYRAKSCITE